MDIDLIEKIMEKQKDFSGVVSVKENQKTIFERSCGYANRNHLIPNQSNTKFGIASGAKLFTAVAICQLVERGILRFDTLLKDCLSITFPSFNPNINIHHLLTHSSGIGDYFDEEIMEDFSELWKNKPMYMMKRPQDFLPMFQDKNMDFPPEERFKYNNAGFLLLGLIIEEQTRMTFTDYVEKYIFEPCKMSDSGYFSFDCLPERTAYGYIQEETGNWKTNIYSIPVMGGPDGGAYTTAGDLSKLWQGIFAYSVLNKELTEKMLTPYIQVKDNFYYGYGIWMIQKDSDIFKYYIMGHDPGVSMMSSIYPKNHTEVTILGNTEFGTWNIAREIQLFIK